MTEGIIQGMTEGVIEGMIPWVTEGVIQGVTEGVVPGILPHIGKTLCLLALWRLSNWCDGTDLVPCRFAFRCRFSSNIGRVDGVVPAS